MRPWAVLVLACHCGAPCVRTGTGSGSCEALACPNGAHAISTTGGHSSCACNDGLASFGGACVPPADREAVCGPSSVVIEGGCARKPCPANNVIDGATGVCLPVGSVRALADPIQVALLLDETLACSADANTLVVGGNAIACVPKENACGPGAVFDANGKKCVALRACPPGEVPFASDRCERVVRAGEIVDVATWTRAMIGVDGGSGSPFLCGGFQSAPWTFTPATDVRLELVVALDIRFPDNDITQARAHVEAMLGAGGTGQPAPVEGLAKLVDRLISSLRALGGTSRASAVSTRVRCNLAVGGRPIAVPFTPARSP